MIPTVFRGGLKNDMVRKKSRLYTFFLWVTNNKPEARNWEVRFDIFFFITGTITTVYAIIKLLMIGDSAWASIVWLFYIGFLDTLRHNRA